VCAFSVARVITRRTRPPPAPMPGDLALTALWPQERTPGLHGAALRDMDFRNRASSNFCLTSCQDPAPRTS
jgi:hypothetical protein